ncbi:MAG: hypothetical protein IKF17_04610 [Clostridia bacterium]|nr:hypothetical protein [Clostridia bacterium]
MEMSLNTKLEVAVEIISAKIANMSNAGYTTENPEMQELLKEMDKMYTGDEETIDRIINIYGPEIKRNYEGV